MKVETGRELVGETRNVEEERFLLGCWGAKEEARERQWIVGSGKVWGHQNRWRLEARMDEGS